MNLIFLLFALLFLPIGIIWVRQGNKAGMLCVLLGTVNLIWFLVKIIY